MPCNSAPLESKQILRFAQNDTVRSLIDKLHAKRRLGYGPRTITLNVPGSISGSGCGFTGVGGGGGPKSAVDR